MKVQLHSLRVIVGPNERLIEVRRIEGKRLYAEGVVAVPTDEEVAAAKKAFHAMDRVEEVA